MARRKADSDARSDSFPARLRRARLQKDLSQSELGANVGIHYNQIGRYEQGTSSPTAENIQKLAEALDVSADYLMKGDQEGALRAKFEDRELLELFQKAATLSPENKTALKRIINALINQERIEEMAVR